MLLKRGRREEGALWASLCSYGRRRKKEELSGPRYALKKREEKRRSSLGLVMLLRRRKREEELSGPRYAIKERRRRRRSSLGFVMTLRKRGGGGALWASLSLGGGEEGGAL